LLLWLGTENPQEIESWYPLRHPWLSLSCFFYVGLAIATGLGIRYKREHHTTNKSVFATNASFCAASILAYLTMHQQYGDSNNGLIVVAGAIGAPLLAGVICGFLLEESSQQSNESALK
jgi:predicted permease